MKETKKKLAHYAAYDILTIQSDLEEMASKGWMLEKTGDVFWTYRKTDPKNLTFAITFFPGATEYDAAPSESQLTKEEFCAEDGWNLVCRWDSMQIFYNERENPTPIDTDPVTQVETIGKAMRKKFNFIYILWIIWLSERTYYFSKVFLTNDDPTPFTLSVAIIFALNLLVIFLDNLSHYLWYKKAKRTAEEDGYFYAPRPANKALGFFLLIILIAALLIPYLKADTIKFLPLSIISVFILIISEKQIKKWTKKKQWSSQKNQLVTHVGAFIISLSVTVLLAILF